MELEVVKIAASQGIWAVLSIVLIFFILRNQEKRDQIQAEREEKYQLIINTLSEKLEIIKDVKVDVEAIKNRLSK
ncbi:MAG: hypothetical protein BGO41_01305 [Clostridiales bacterium 38-18]|nr:MAG: hypothetical protein BGO41_01305 [Clostridiales bacterium 38-18]